MSTKAYQALLQSVLLAQKPRKYTLKAYFRTELKERLKRLLTTYAEGMPLKAELEQQGLKYFEGMWSSYIAERQHSKYQKQLESKYFQYRELGAKADKEQVPLYRCLLASVQGQKVIASKENKKIRKELEGIDALRTKMLEAKKQAKPYLEYKWDLREALPKQGLDFSDIANLEGTISVELKELYLLLPQNQGVALERLLQIIELREIEAAFFCYLRIRYKKKAGQLRWQFLEDRGIYCKACPEYATEVMHTLLKPEGTQSVLIHPPITPIIIHVALQYYIEAEDIKVLAKIHDYLAEEKDFGVLTTLELADYLEPMGRYATELRGIVNKETGISLYTYYMSQEDFYNVYLMPIATELWGSYIAGLELEKQKEYGVEVYYLSNTKIGLTYPSNVDLEEVCQKYMAYPEHIERG